MFFYKRFQSFDEGITEMRGACQAVNECLTTARERIRIPTEALVPLGVVLDIGYERVLKFMLIDMASESPKFRPMIYARANKDGFSYRTGSEYVFGWRKHKSGYTFALSLGKVKNFSNRASLVENLRSLNWKEAATKKERIDNVSFVKI